MKKKVITALVCVSMLAQTGAFAMTTREFDNGMAKGISYFNRGLYYEAKDEFTWFKEYNYSKMNSGQQKYLDDYLNGTNNRIVQWENYLRNHVTSGEQAIELVKNYQGSDSWHYRYLYYEKGNYYLVTAISTAWSTGAAKYRVYKNDSKVVYIGAGSEDIDGSWYSATYEP